MDQVDLAQARADEKQAAFMDTLSDFNSRVRGGAVFTEVLRQSGLGKWKPAAAVKKVRQHPLIMAGAVLAALLAWKAWSAPKIKGGGGKSRQIQIRLSNRRKGDHHGKT